MKNGVGYAIVLISVLLLGGCRPITFTTPPGSQREIFPVEMQGRYVSVEKHKSGNDSTILLINETLLEYVMHDEINDMILNDSNEAKRNYRSLRLSDSTILSHLGDYYFYNIRITGKSGYSWWTFPVKVDEKTLYIYTLTQGKQQKKLERYLKLSGNASGEYRMENEPFEKYCEKHLRKRKSIKLKRIK